MQPSEFHAITFLSDTVSQELGACGYANEKLLTEAIAMHVSCNATSQPAHVRSHALRPMQLRAY